jgi:hypothetical protein
MGPCGRRVRISVFCSHVRLFFANVIQIPCRYTNGIFKPYHFGHESPLETETILVFTIEPLISLKISVFKNLTKFASIRSIRAAQVIPL